MMTVSILINGKPIYTRSANNVSPENIKDGEENIYHVDTGEKIKHMPEDGVVVLAKKLLDTIKEE